ncbi:hypothetical protein [Sorangium sp. So ce854]|uniref:STAS domain-containing protein n=1 Tax=Sorangium cellulosum TaxID=56 RepID=A0A150P249_SORCE|nr:hypothetical protein BE08_38975 [Sorangium cellulosum]
MYSVDNRAGRLIEVRLASPLPAGEVDACIARIQGVVTQNRHGAVICIELLQVDVLAPESAEKFLEMMRVQNATVHRTAYLLPVTNAILGLQVERLIRDAHNSSRKAFRDTTSLEAWLVPVMTMVEAQQLRKFLSQLG